MAQAPELFLYTVLTDAKEVAGMKNPGKDKVIKLTKLQAEHPERIGHIEPKKSK
jgi:hypothetical protein